MDRASKCKLANEILDTYALDFFDHEGILIEEEIDALIEIFKKHTLLIPKALHENDRTKAH